MRLSDFDYPLDKGLIAQQPLPIRDRSRLMVYDRTEGKTVHSWFSALPDLLRPEDLLVLNNTRVRPVRIRGKKRSGGKVEVLFLRGMEGGIWETLVGGGIRVGSELSLPGGRNARVVELLEGGRRRVVLDEWGGTEDWFEKYGETPLPPYIRREAGPLPGDRERYQTVYATTPGSVAAPTAGLHFTHGLLARLRQRGIRIGELTLHVGAGTFQPIRTEEIGSHRMEAESYIVPEETLDAIAKTRSLGGRVIAVGTTATRALESAFKGGRSVRPQGETDLFIQPGRPFEVVQGLITNFHLPRSTLLVLVAAFLGRSQTLSLYEEAAQARYRFYSYGDAMCIL